MCFELKSLLRSWSAQRQQQQKQYLIYNACTTSPGNSFIIYFCSYNALQFIGFMPSNWILFSSPRLDRVHLIVSRKLEMVKSGQFVAFWLSTNLGCHGLVRGSSFLTWILLMCCSFWCWRSVWIQLHNCTCLWQQVYWIFGVLPNTTSHVLELRSCISISKSARHKSESVFFVNSVRVRNQFFIYKLCVIWWVGSGVESVLPVSIFLWPLLWLSTIFYDFFHFVTDC